jgi:hypothetical protein
VEACLLVVGELDGKRAGDVSMIWSAGPPEFDS